VAPGNLPRRGGDLHRVKNAVEQFKNHIQKETQALKLEFAEKIAQGTLLDIDGIELTVEIEIAK
jgi:hypothetical protein